MIKVRNLSTGEVICISQTGRDKSTGRIVTNGTPSKKFLAKYPLTATDEKNAEGDTFMELYDGFELLTGKRLRLPKEAEAPAEAPAAEDVPVEAVPETTEAPVEMEAVIEAEDVDEVPAEAPVEAPVEEPKPRREKKAEPKVKAKPQTDGLQDALSLAFAPVFAKVAKEIEENVRAKVQGEIDALKAQAKTHVQRIELVTPDGAAHEVEGLFCDEFEDMCADVNNGWSPYLYGAAGCGKSHTAEQIAKALGLDFYTQNMLNFAHEVAGYGNAAGEFVETPFFNAFSKGGLFFLDEADRSQVEGLVVLNQALAQGVFNFPVVGNVKAHPKFRFMCAGNTRMNGADEMYTSGQTQDASFKRRVIFYEMKYDRRIELPIMAQGDEVLVNFVEDVRRAIERTGTLHFVSYTETKYMKEHEDKKEKALVRSTFKSLDRDIIRQIYGELEDKDNVWAKALKNVVNGRV